tara:strand:+ start:397 stop:636 length:240 start_codon:yes stop_codon:yes gene_type:complete
MLIAGHIGRHSHLEATHASIQGTQLSGRECYQVTILKGKEILARKVFYIPVITPECPYKEIIAGTYKEAKEFAATYGVH